MQLILHRTRKNYDILQQRTYRCMLKPTLLSIIYSYVHNASHIQVFISIYGPRTCEIFEIRNSKCNLIFIALDSATKELCDQRTITG